jgi:hypothetical protein
MKCRIFSHLSFSQYHWELDLAIHSTSKKQGIGTEILQKRFWQARMAAASRQYNLSSSPKKHWYVFRAGLPKNFKDPQQKKIKIK